MKIQPIYNDLNGAPMNFHKFLCVVIWIGVVVNFIGIVNVLISLNEGANLYVIVYLLLYCANLVCAFIAAVELPKMKWNGVKAYFATFALQVVVYINNLVFSALYGLDLYEPIVQVVSSIIVSCIFLIPLYIYYGKRRNLFYPFATQFCPNYSGFAEDDSTVNSNPKPMEYLKETDASQSNINYIISEQEENDKVNTDDTASFVESTKIDNDVANAGEQNISISNIYRETISKYTKEYYKLLGSNGKLVIGNNDEVMLDPNSIPVFARYTLEFIKYVQAIVRITIERHNMELNADELRALEEEFNADDELIEVAPDLNAVAINGRVQDYLGLVKASSSDESIDKGETYKGQSEIATYFADFVVAVESLSDFFSIEDTQKTLNYIKRSERLKNETQSLALKIYDDIDDQFEKDINSSIKNEDNKDDLYTEMETKEEKPLDITYCRFCGKQVDSEGVFCKHCGKRIR